MCSNIKDNQVYTQTRLGVQRLLRHCSRRGLPFQHLPHLCTANMLLNARMCLVMVEVLKRLCGGCSSLTSWNNIRGLFWRLGRAFCLIFNDYTWCYGESSVISLAM